MSKIAWSNRKKAAKAAGRIILVLGGAASGKSEFALQIVAKKHPKAFVATGQGLDDEMAVRIARHQAARGSDWTTAEAPVQVAEWFEREGKAYRAIVVDCVTLWLSNLHGVGVTGAALTNRVVELLAAMRRANATIAIVSNELGWGLVPMDEAARRFRDAAGRVNQQIASAADEVYLVVSGLPLRVK